MVAAVGCVLQLVAGKGLLVPFVALRGVSDTLWHEFGHSTRGPFPHSPCGRGLRNGTLWEATWWSWRLGRWMRALPCPGIVRDRGVDVL